MLKQKVKSQVDLNDLAFVEERYGLVLESYPCPQDKLTQKINPHVSKFKVLGKTDSFVSVFHVKPIYYEHVTSTEEVPVWRPLYEVCEFYGNKQIVAKYEALDEISPNFLRWLIRRQEVVGGNLHITNPYNNDLRHVLTDRLGVKEAATISFTTTTVYPDPDPETTTFDGRCYIQNGSNWDEMHDRTTSQGVDDSGTGLNIQNNASTRIYRAFTLFDTSAISTDTIDSATYSLYATSSIVNNNDGNDFVAIVDVTVASNTALAVGDYDGCGDAIDNPTEMHATADRLDISSELTTSAYNDFSFNATGLSKISKTGVSKFGFRLGWDIVDSAPSGSNECTFSSADTTGTTSDPKLVVVHSASGTTINPSAQALTFSLPAETVSGQASVSVNTQSATFSLPAETVTADWVVSPNAQVATFSVPSYIVSAGGIVLMPDVQTLTFSLPAEQILAGAVLSPDGQSLTFSVPTASITADWTVGVDPQVLTVTVPTLEFIGALWARYSRNAGDWTRGARNDDY